MKRVFTLKKEWRKRKTERANGRGFVCILGIFLSAVLVFDLLPAGGLTAYASGQAQEGASGADAVKARSGDLDFSSAASDMGSLETDGYQWNAGSKTLRLKNAAISASVILPDDTVRIETEGECSLDTLSIAGGNPQKTHLTFSGTGKLTIDQQINICGGNDNWLTVERGAHVIANGGISIGTSGAADSVVTVNGTLTAVGALSVYSNAVSAGKVVVGAGGLLDVSGANGVALNGVNVGVGSYTVAGAFTIERGGCFTANCSAYNVRVSQLAGNPFNGEGEDLAVSLPDKEAYLPADCEVKVQGGEVNLVKKGTEVVYTGLLTIHENHAWPGGWNRKNEAGHWKECTFEGCSKTTGYGAHTYDDSTFQCDACGAVLSIALENPEGMIYDGREKKPGVSVKVDNTLLEASRYEVSYSSNVNAGEASVTVTGKGELGFQNTAVFRIAKAVPVVAWGSAGQTVTYSGSQAQVTPPGVTLVNGERFGGRISYSYAAEGESDYTPGLPVNAGTYIVKAVVLEQGNYTAVESAGMTLTVKQADNAPNMPADTMKVPNRCEQVSAVALPENWQWREADGSTALKVGVPQEAMAVYTGADRANYKNVEVLVTITRADRDSEVRSPRTGQ